MMSNLTCEIMLTSPVNFVFIEFIKVLFESLSSNKLYTFSNLLCFFMKA